MLVSIHIPKTGGTAFRRSALEPTYGNRLLLDYADAPLSKKSDESNRLALAYEPPANLRDLYDCVHGHFIATKYVSKNLSCQFAVWFRDPEQRLLSRYFYAKRSGKGMVGSDMSVEEFLEIDKFQNTYASYLWNFDIHKFDFIGIVEHYTTSLSIFRKRFGLPASNFFSRLNNANPDKSEAEPYVVAARLRTLIRRTNREDFEIYEAALSIHERLKNRYL